MKSAYHTAVYNAAESKDKSFEEQLRILKEAKDDHAKQRSEAFQIERLQGTVAVWYRGAFA